MASFGLMWLVIGYYLLLLLALCNGQLAPACILPVRKICSDPFGNTTLGEFNLTLNVSEAYGGDNWISPSIASQTIKFRLTPPNYDTTWHNCPVPQFIMNMNAANKVTFTNGDTTVFKAGEIFYCDDRSSSGHKSQSVGNNSRYSVFVEVDDSFNAGPCPGPSKKDKSIAIDYDIPLCSDVTSAAFMALNQIANE